MMREIKEIAAAGLCVVTAIIGALTFVQWSGAWTVFPAIGEVVVWLSTKPGFLGGVLFLGFYFGVGAILMILVRSTRRALFRRQESN